MPNTNIKVAIVDDDEEIREGLRWILDNTHGYSCVGTYKNCPDAVTNLPTNLPDVVLMDIGLPGQSGVECAGILKSMYPALHIIMQTVHSSDDKIFDSLRSGASGYILKKTSPEKLLEAIQEVNEGGAPMSGEVARKVLTFFQTPKTDKSLSQLSDRELDVLKLLIEGHSYKIIAEKLFVSPHTVRFHLHNIYEKLHVRSRMEAVAKSVKNKWF